MAISLDDILQAEQASNIAAMARAHTQQMDMQQKQYLKLLTSVDLVEAAAAKELGKAGIASDLASIRGGATTPPI
jgi:hypothetical protein